MANATTTNSKPEGKYQISRRIGQGSFGDVYLGMNLASKTDEEVAVKIEAVGCDVPLLRTEANVYKLLIPFHGFPSIRYFGQEGDFNVLVLDLLGPSLEDLFNFCKRRFSMKTTLMLADQMISRLEHVHNVHYVHCDVKPENFLMGLRRNAHVVHLIDFGLAKKFRDPQTLKHVPYSEGRTLLGTARYASLNSMLGVEQTRRDDLESIGYMLVYFLKGSLPWQGFGSDHRKARSNRVAEAKMSTPLSKLCEGLPREFFDYLEYCQDLAYDADPNYEYLRGLFRTLFESRGYAYGSAFDWCIIQPNQLELVKDNSRVQARLVEEGYVLPNT
eukprot:Rmarinus@m.2